MIGDDTIVARASYNIVYFLSVHRRCPCRGFRYKLIRDMVKEEAETDAMVVTDRESRRLMEYHRALSTIGRVVLGYKGRKLARERRREDKLEEVRVSQ